MKSGALLSLEPLSHRERGRGEGPDVRQRFAKPEPSSGALRHLLPAGEGNTGVVA